MDVQSGNRISSRTYVHSEDEGINSFIDSKINYLIQSILDVVKPKSIFLYGSFGRGEGTVFMDKDGYKIISDFEIGVVTSNLKSVGHLKTLGRKMQEDGDDVTLSIFTPQRFKLGRVSNWSFFPPFPTEWTLEQYELIGSLRILYGIDPRESSISISSSSIMKWDALRLLFNRTAEVLETLAQSDVSPGSLEKSLNKLLISCGDATLLLVGKYHFSYYERYLLLKEISAQTHSKTFPLEINWAMVLDAYKWKLNPSGESSSIFLSTIVENALLPALRFCVEQIFGWSFLHAEEFRHKYISSPNLQFCSRAYAGYSHFQTAILTFRQLFYHRDLNFNLESWKTVHENYVDIIDCLSELNDSHSVSIEQGKARIVPEVSEEKRIRLTQLVERWHLLSTL